MAGRASITTSCGDLVRSLLEGRWQAWTGLPGDCSLASIAGEMGGADVLDPNAALGREGVSCARSTLGGAPAVLWHRKDRLLLVECDFADAPRRPPALDGAGVHRLDIYWGAAFLEGGEAVIPGRGLALILASGTTVVACRGFPPMGIDEYVGTRRPPTGPLKPFRPLPRGGTAP